MLHGPLKRIHAWRVPPNWSSRDWFEEMEAQSVAAACQAACDFNPSYGLPFGAFVRQRVLASALTRYRQEWAFALNFVAQIEADGCEILTAEPLGCGAFHESLRIVLTCLSEPEHSLLHQLFWEEYTEAEVALVLGISQQAVSKRKRQVLDDLRRCLGVPERI